MKKSIYTFIAALGIFTGLVSGGIVAHAQATGTATYTMPDPVLTGVNAAIAVTINGDLAKADKYAIQVGTTTDKGRTCIKDPNIPASTPTSSTDGKTLELSHTATILMGRTYCVTITKEFGVLLPSVVHTFEGQTFFVPGTSTVTGSSTSDESCTPNANGCCTTKNDSYCMLAPLPGIGELDANGRNTGRINFGSCTVDGVKTEGSGFGCYVNGIVKIVVGLVGVLSVVMLIVSGIEIMTTTSGTEKSAGKERAKNAVIGLILAVGSYTILNTINPNLTNLSVLIPKSSLTYDDSAFQESEFTAGPTTQMTLKPTSMMMQGFVCPGSGGSAKIPAILASMQGKVTYRFGGGHSPNQPPYTQDTYMCPKFSATACSSFCPAGQLCLDCSAFADTVLQCAGFAGPGGGTGTIFSTGAGGESVTESDIVINGTTVTIRGAALKNGDLVGWLAGEHKKDSAGHVFVFSEGNLYDSHGGNGGRVAGQATGVWPFSKYKSAIKHVYRVK